MTITHAAIYTQNLKKLEEFYCRWFGGKAGPEYENPSKGFSSRFISFESGARLELMHSRNLNETVRREFTAGYAHLAFSTESEREVDNLTARMKEEGVPVVSGPRRTGDGYYESCVLDPDGNRVEITAG
ncbi:Glyoxalase/Bleomycin resistance protein/Dioxygenase superfamily protein [Caprobacter fermentans]|uniref:Glyoxalase/Bleomycin resistance protein/Dioxygenase superfamily protein n=1 Tax=Caproicibacter fermentans TaxID=2576756 RepID=A0A6N8HYK5_9FIRM|nr:VOC family protein [Caproicibacter fermentans]MVB10934.1 Glyoxalase/Bleomycin resistance protein/Dioxygenase superfamily protein [Caproicibacter fermentans]OCN01638.1 glyoxalase [Clostridium sp. W14A]QNK39448.1 VOC family protein [Caproicibacter fermentans]